MKTKLTKGLTISVIISLLSMIFTLSPVSATTTLIYLDPSNNIYTTDTAYVGYKFNVTVWVENAPDIGGANVKLVFDDSIINVTRWWAPYWDPDFFMPDPYKALPSPPNPGYIHVSSGNGYVKVAVSKAGYPPVAPWGHNGTICILEFIITAVPTEPGKYTSSLLIDSAATYLLDPVADEIPGVVKENGYYEIRKPGLMYDLTISAASGGTTDPSPGIHTYESGTTVSVTAIPAINYLFDHWELDGLDIGSSNPVDVTMDANHALHALFIYSLPEGSRIFVDPPEIINPNAVPCQTIFTINVSIDDIADMKTCEFNLTYDTDVISLIGLNFLSVNGRYPMLELIANDTAGFLWMKLAYSTAITVSDPTPLVTITFHVDNLGATPLNLTSTKLTDSNDNLIPHDVYHGFFMAQIRDVAVTNIVLSRTWTYPGWPVNITVTVKNNGNASETFNVCTYYDSHVIGTITVNDLASNEERDIIFEWDTTGVAEGNYTIKAEAEHVPYEVNTSDNTFIDGKVWIMIHFHDVAIVSVASESWVFQGWIVQINVTARNDGDFTESFNISAYYNTTLIGMVEVINLASGNNYTAQFSLNTSTLLICHTYTITGEATLVPFEYNEANNVLVDGVLKVRLLGDVNGDDNVDLKDVFAVSLAFGSFPGHPDWNPLADINRDNTVDLKDVFIVSINYGKVCPS